MPASAAEAADELHMTVAIEATQESKNIVFMKSEVP